MNKQKFLRELNKKLKKLKKEERNKYIEYYDEIISDIIESGASEEEAIERQGDVERIAEDIIANTNPVNLRGRGCWGIVLIAASCIMLFGCIVPMLFNWQYELKMATSIGIIGGADGPTSIFLAGKIARPWGLYIATAVVVIVTIIYFIKTHKKK